MIFHVVGEVLAGSDGDVESSERSAGHAASQTLLPAGRGLKEQAGERGGGDGVGGVVFRLPRLGNKDAERGIHERHHAQHLRRGRRSLRHVVEDLRPSERAAVVGATRFRYALEKTHGAADGPAGQHGTADLRKGQLETTSLSTADALGEDEGVLTGGVEEGGVKVQVGGDDATTGSQWDVAEFGGRSGEAPEAAEAAETAAS